MQCDGHRRHGIQRWPRRQLVKLSKALDEHISEQQGKGEDVTGAPFHMLVCDSDARATCLLHMHLCCINTGLAAM